jgi:hypothetical protein
MAVSNTINPPSSQAIEPHHTTPRPHNHNQSITQSLLTVPIISPHLDFKSPVLYLYLTITTLHDPQINPLLFPSHNPSQSPITCK